MDVFLLDIKNIKKDDIDLVKNKMPLRYAKANHHLNHNDFLRNIGSSLLLLRHFNNLNEDEIMYSQNGKPYIKHREKFSLSHSGEYVALVLSSTIIGIDIEKVDLKKIKVAKRVFTLDEQKAVKDNNELFFDIWTKKESISKATGLGFSLSPLSYSILKVDEEGTILANNQHWYSNTIQYEDYYLSVSSLEKIENINIVKE